MKANKQNTKIYYFVANSVKHKKNNNEILVKIN
jgi:hypothetical protein